MRSVALLVLVLSSAAQARTPRFVAPGLRVTNLKASLAQDFTDHLAQQLTARGLSVITSSDVQAILGLERQKQLLGCSDEASSCMTELAGALGAEGVVVGTVVRMGKVFQVNLRVIGASDAKPLALYSTQVDREEALFEAMEIAARSLVNDLQPFLTAKAKAEPHSPASGDVPTAAVEEPLLKTRPGPRRSWWIPTIAAGVFGVSAAIFLSQAAAAFAELNGTMAAPAGYAPQDTVARGKTFEALGWTSAVLAGASLLVAGGLLAFGADEVVVSVAPGREGAALVLGGAW